MIILEHDDPKFICNTNIKLTCMNEASVELDQDEPISVSKLENGNVLIGDSSSILIITTETLIEQFLASINACDFDLIDVGEENEEFEGEFTKSNLIDSIVSIKDKFGRLPLNDINNSLDKSFIVKSITPS